MNVQILASLTTLSVLGLDFTLTANAQQSLSDKNNPAEKPNIIFILTDDQRWDALGFAGNEIIYTPEMDQLAREGCWFRNSFVTTPICAASRASIMTGLYERTHDFTFGTPPLEKQFIDISYPTLLKKDGYSTGFIGKFGMHFKNKADTGIFDYYRRPGEQFWATTYYRLNKDHTKHRHLTTEIGDLSLEFIEKYKEEGPFCLSVSFHAPHAEDCDPRQYIYPVELDTLYQDITIPDPLLSSDEDFMNQPEWVRDGFNRVRWYWRFDTPEKYQQMVKGYYRMISGVDREIGRIREKLTELGIDDNTIIILMGDNGYFLGERQFAGKWLMYDNSLRVPLIIFDPMAENHIIEDYMGLNIDIAPTILDYCGLSIPSQMQGNSLKNLIRPAGNEPAQREYFLCEHLFDHDRIAKSEGIRTNRYKYFRYIDHPEHEEFYDLKYDPDETKNLIRNPEYQEDIDRLRKILENSLSEIN